MHAGNSGLIILNSSPIYKDMKVRGLLYRHIIRRQILGLYYNVWDAVSNSSKYNILAGNQLIQLYVHICVYNTGTQT